MQVEQQRKPWGRVVAVVVLIALATAACGNSSDKDATGDSTSTTKGDQVSISGVPGVTDDAISVSVLGTRSNNPLGTCVLDCFLDGIKSYFDFRNSEGGIYGRQLEVGKDIDDELGNNKVKALEIVSANDTFATFSAAQLANGWGELAKAGIPLYVWEIHPGEASGQLSTFGNREVVCISCTNRSVPYVAKLAKAKKVATLGYGISDDSKKCAQSGAASVKRYGSEVGATVAYENDHLDFGLPNGIGPEVTAMKEAGVDLVAACLDLNGMKTLAQELQRQGINDKVTLYHPNSYDQQYIKEGGDLFEGDFVGVGFRPFEANAGSSALADYQKWMKKAGRTLSEPAMVGWIDADLFYQGLKAAGPSFDRQKVVDATNEMTAYTAGGLSQPIDWSRQHVAPTEDDLATNGPAQDCTSIVKVHDGAFQVVGDKAKPWLCWPGDTRDWSEPTSMNFK
jgi:ABC-type branched-subunit amino acid transport system substrate-binding protein